MGLAASLAAYEHWGAETPLRIPLATLCLGFAVHALRYRHPTLLQETVPGLLAPDGSLHLLRGEPNFLYATNLGHRAAAHVHPGAGASHAVLESLIARASLVMRHRATHSLLFEPTPMLSLAPVLFRKADVDWCTRRLGWPETVIAERISGVATIMGRALKSGRVPSHIPVSSRCFRREALAVFHQPSPACGACGCTRALLPCPDCGRASHCDDACRRADPRHGGRCAHLLLADHTPPQPEHVEAMLADVTDPPATAAGAFGSPI